MPARPGRVIQGDRPPYTRVSKAKPRKSYAVGVPHSKIHTFQMGNKEKEFDVEMYLVSKEKLRIRSIALEAARVSIHKVLEESTGGPENFFFKILVYPHDIVREHSIATGAGADRFSQGMRKAFGRPVGKAARVDVGQDLVVVKVNKPHMRFGREALKRASSKVPCKTTIRIKEKRRE